MGNAHNLGFLFVKSYLFIFFYNAQKEMPFKNDLTLSVFPVPAWVKEEGGRMIVLEVLSSSMRQQLESP